MADCPRSHVILTEKIKRWIRTILTTENLPSDTREELRKYTSSRRTPEDKKARTIPFELVKTVHKYVQAEEGGLYLHELLEGSDAQLHEVEPPPRNAELEARIQKLKSEQANREYAQMTKNVDLQKQNKDNVISDIKKDVKAINNQLLSVFNFLVTVIGSFVFAYKATEYAMDTPDFRVQLVTGLIVATIVFFADLWFLIRYTA